MPVIDDICSTRRIERGLDRQEGSSLREQEPAIAVAMRQIEAGKGSIDAVMFGGSRRPKQRASAQSANTRSKIESTCL